MKNHRKKAVAILAGLAVTGIVGASAASLGTVTGQSLGATTEVVASCDDAVVVDYVTSYNETTNTVVVDSVNVTGLHDDCRNLDWDLRLTADTATSPSPGEAPRAELGQKNDTIGAAANSFTADFTLGGTVPSTIDAEAVTGLVLTISG